MSMKVVYVCSNCDKKQEALLVQGEVFPPKGWYAVTNPETDKKIACSRTCFNSIIVGMWRSKC